MSKSVNVFALAFDGYLQTSRLRSSASAVRRAQTNGLETSRHCSGLWAGWVSQTLKTYREQGESGLTTGKRTGAPSRLTADQLDQLTRELAKGAEQHGFSGQVWTRPRINQVIHKLFGVSYDPSQIGRLLKKVGWSRQKPARQARQQDSQAVANWREERLPALKKSQS